MKISIKTIEKFIEREEDNIHALDEKSLPMVLAEIQAEQAQIDKVKDHRTITHVSREAVEWVLNCWMMLGEGDTWYKEMEAYEVSLQPGA